MRQTGQKIVMLTAYDYTFARLVDENGADVILVGDSLASVVQGFPHTLGVTLDEMIYHVNMVSRAARRALVVADMPFMSYQLGPKEALTSAGRFVKEAGAHAVKLEGGTNAADSIRCIVGAGIPVMAHVGLMPQSYHTMGGFKVQGRTQKEALRILADALAAQAAGAFAVVLEGIPSDVARQITMELSVPTIGIGAGSFCSGQVLVIHDLLGLSAHEHTKIPKFVKRYAGLSLEVAKAVRSFAGEVRSGAFPGPEHSYDAKEE